MNMERLSFNWKGRNAGKTYEMPTDFASKWHLSTDGYYFKYRPDRNDPTIIRATLFLTKDNKEVSDIRVSAYPEFGLPHKSHHDVINHFEAEITLKWQTK